MVIEFKQMPAARRTPGQYTELNAVIANRGLSVKPVSVLFIGQRLSTGDIAEAVLKELFGADEARDYWGRGSMLARMIEAGFNSNPYLKAYGIGLNDAGAATASTQTVTFTDTASAAGVVKVLIGGELIEVPYASGDTKDDVAAAVAAEITAVLTPDLPMIASVALGVVTLTARNKGTVGNSIDVYAEVTPNTTLTVAVAAGVSGATDPDLQTALDVVPLGDFDFIVSGLNDTTSLGKLEAHVNGLVHPLKSLGALGIYATTGTLSAATTLSENFKTCGFMSGAWCENSPTWEPEVAARYAAVLASHDDPALPYNHLDTGVLSPRLTSDFPSASEIESVLWEGVSPLVPGAGDKVRIVRAITTKTHNDAGAADDALLDVTAPRTLFWLRYQIHEMLASKYPRAKNTQQRRDSIRQDVLKILRDAEQLEIVENVDDNEDGVLVEVNGSDPTRCDVKVPADIVDGLHVIATRIDLTR